MFQDLGVAIFDLDPKLVADNQEGTKNNIEKSKEEFTHLAGSVITVLNSY